MVVGFLAMLVGLVLFGLARSTNDKDQPRFQGGARMGLFGGGGVLMAFGLMLCIGRMIQWTQAIGDL